MTSTIEPGTVTRTHALGTRDDPHSQERAARSAPLLLHSLSLFREVFDEIYARRSISTVVEIGVETGQVSGIYAELGASRVYCIDPFPSDAMRAAVAANDSLELVERFSPECLVDLPVADLYVVDGDHNYATVRGEVDWILEHAPDAVVVLHDLAWPSARRDSYYQPTRLGEHDRHADTAEGPTVWHDGVTPAGFIGAGAFTMSVHAGGERNGVLTAVEDAITAATDPLWELEIIPAVFGVGVLVRRTQETAELIDAIRRYSGSRLLAALENNRIALYTRVLQMQHEMVAHAADADRLAETIAGQLHTIDELTRTADALRDRLDRTVAEHLAERQRRVVPRTLRVGRRVAGKGRRFAAHLLNR